MLPHNEITLAADERLDEVNEHIRLIQKKNGLFFGSDAYLLYAFMRNAPRARAADLGCGTGIISLLCAARSRFSHITAVELQEEFAQLATRNVTLNGLNDRISVLCQDVRQLTPAVFGGELDVIFSNPPYMKVNSGKPCLSDARQIARHETAGGIADFCLAAAKCLKYGGLFYTVWRPDRLPSLITALEDAGLAPKRMLFVHDRPQRSPAMVLTEAKRGAAEGLSVLPPLFLHDREGDALSDEAQRIYDTGIIQDT